MSKRVSWPVYTDYTNGKLALYTVNRKRFQWRLKGLGIYIYIYIIRERV